MNQPITVRSFELVPDDPQCLANLCGQFDAHIKQIAHHFTLDVFNRGNQFKIIGEPASAHCAQNLFERLYREAQQGTSITPDLIHLFLQEADVELVQVGQTTSKTSHRYASEPSSITDAMEEDLDTSSRVIKTPKALIRARGPNQVKYVSRIRQLDINFGIGPAGTGKTYLAVACAVEALMADEVERILLVRPAVEAGEKLGFLPGDLAQKIDPYLRPLYDALYDMLGYEQVGRLIERNLIEIAPLAYMRGRTLSNAYVILDESQNTTCEQMKMFLTRIGFGSKAVITGDVTQIDLPRGKYSGLKQVIQVLDKIDGIGFTHFANRDVVRHPLVQRIVDAYDVFETTADETPHQTTSFVQTESFDQPRADHKTSQGPEGTGK